LHSIKKVDLVIKHGIVEAHHDGAAVRQGGLRPRACSQSGLVEGVPDIRWRRLRQSRNQRSVSGAEMFVMAF
jgi:hypothetical protein